MKFSTVAVCPHHQKGHCKWGPNCKKEHMNTLCSNLFRCEEPSCRLRHPRTCKYFAIDNFCKFGSKCSYTHKVHVESVHASEVVSIRETISDLQMAIVQLNKSVDYLDKELTKVKNERNSDKSELNIKCNHCEYKASSVTVLKCHITKNHKH